jgi:hypothetical protein
VKVLESKTPLDQALALQLAQHFHHNDFGWIVAANLDTPNWTTRKDRDLCIGELVREYLDIERLIGVNFGKTTKYALIDLDYSSQYHPSHDRDRYKEILHALESIGLTRYIVIQSSYSRGLHIYLPLPKAVSTFWLAAAIRVTLTNAGFEIKNGQLEIFPNTKRFASAPGDHSHYNPHRMPLQPNSGSWLMEDDGLSPQPISDSIEAQIGEFLNQWQLAADKQDLDLLNRKLPQLYKTYKNNKYKYRDRNDDWNSVEAEKWRLDLLLTITIGWWDCHQTYNLLPKILAYGVVFLKLQGEALSEWMLETILNAPGYYQYCRHQHEIEKIVRSWIKTNERTQYYTPYCSHPDRSQSFPFGKTRKVKIVRKANIGNIRRSDEAKSRIEAAYQILKDEFTAETKITEMRERLRAKIQEMYGIGIGTDTLTRHKNIWHPEYNIQENTSLSQKSEQCPESLLAEELSDGTKILKNIIGIEQISDQIESDYSKFSMICGEDRPQLESDPSQLDTNLPSTISTQPHSLEDELVPAGAEQELSTYTQHYNLRPDEVVTQQPKVGKFEVIGGALSKIATLAALVANMLAGTKLDPQPTEDAEIEPDVVTPNADEKIAPPFSVTTPERAEETSLRPCDDPCILPLYITRYNPNQTGVPWTTASEFHKFVGFLVTIAQQDPSISNPYYWAIHTVCDFKDRGINPHWLAFTGQELPYWLKPKERAAEEQLSPIPPSPAAAPDHPQSSSTVAAAESEQPPPDNLPPEPPKFPARVKPPTAQNGHTHGKNCPKCKIPTPLDELERWKMCRFCASTILFKRKR